MHLIIIIGIAQQFSYPTMFCLKGLCVRDIACALAYGTEQHLGIGSA